MRRAFNRSSASEVVPATGSKHVLVINRWHDDFALYDQSIDHRRHRVAYITTRRGLEAVAPQLAEDVLVVDGLDDVERVTAHARALTARHGRFDRVLALSEFDLELGAHLRAMLAAPGPTPADVLRVRDKVTMKAHVARGGVRVPQFTSTSSAEAVRTFARAVGLPVILKPRDGAASAGVIEVGTWEELDAALARVPLERYECEEYVAGDVYQVDGLVVAGELAVLRAGRCINSDLDFARGARAGWVLNDDAELEAQLRAFATRVLRALAIDTSAFHLEVFKAPSRTGDGSYELVFCEIGARLGAAQIPYIWRDLFDIDLQEAWIRVQLDDPVRLPALDVASPIGGFLLVPEPAEVPCRVEATTSLVGRVPGLYAELLPPVGTVLDGHGGYDEIGGRFRFRGASSAEVEAAIRQAMAEYTLEIRPIAAVSVH